MPRPGDRVGYIGVRKVADELLELALGHGLIPSRVVRPGLAGEDLLLAIDQLDKQLAFLDRAQDLRFRAIEQSVPEDLALVGIVCNHGI